MGDGGLRDKDWGNTWYNGTTWNTGGDTCGSTLATYSNQCNTNNYAVAVNTAGLCGANSGCRMPTRRELLSIVHHGTYISAIDTDYFPNTVSGQFLAPPRRAMPARPPGTPCRA